MIIINKEKDVIVNMDNIDAIGFKSNEDEKKTIVAHLVSGNSVELGNYPTIERAREVLDGLINECFEYDICFNMPQDIE